MIARSHLVERPVRTAMTVLGIVLGVAVSIAIRTANVEVLKSFEDAVLAVAGRATLQVSGGELGLDERVIMMVRDQPDVVSASPVVQQHAQVAAGPHRGKPLVVMGLDLIDAADHQTFRLRTETGEEPTLDPLLEPNAVFLGARLATEWSLSAGSPLELLVGTTTHRVVVRGLVESGTGVRTAWEHLAVMDIAAAQALFGSIGKIDRIDLVTDPARPVAEIADALASRLPPSLTVRRPTHRNEQVERMVRAFQLNLATLSGVGLLVGLLLVYNTIAYSVVRHRREIGILRTLGLPRAEVATLFVGEAAVMGLVGGVAGSVFGVLLARQLVSVLGRTVSDLYAPVSVAADGLSLMTPALLIEGGLFGLVMAMLGALAPSVDASRTAPAQALAPGEYENAQAFRAGPLAWFGGGCLVLAGLLALPGPVGGLPLFGYASAFCLLLSLACVAPLLVYGIGMLMTGKGAGERRHVGALGLIAAEQIARAPGRNAITVSALMVGIAIMIGVGIMIQSFRQTVDTWINQTVMADLVVATPGWLAGEESGMQAKRMPLAWAARAAAVPGVAAVDTYRDLTVEIDGRPVSLVSRDLRVHAERSRYLFANGDSAEVLLRTVTARGVVISEVLAGRLGVQEGGLLTLTTPAGERSFPVLGVFYDYATDGGKLVMDRSLYRTLWDDDTTTVIAVYLARDAEAGAVRQRLAGTMGQVGRIVIITNREIKREILEIFDRTFTVTYALEFIAVVIALLGIVNTLLTSVLERQREMATLRAVGASAGQIRRLVLWEGLYLGLLGACLGVAGGVLLSFLLIHVINKQSFGWTIHFQFPAWLVVEGVALAIGAALVASYLPALWAARQPIVDGLRYE
ncbi:MAG TPA: FtsX-like permease family protein [Nitrospiraceae bacterium]|nr:FtsX-like permease family protein [Nitrospiraceae bacterium]